MRALRFAPFALAALSLAGCASSSGRSSVAAASPAPPVASDAAAASTGPSDAGAAKGSGGYGAPASAPAAAAAAGALKIAGFKYDPTPLTVAPGQAVPVTNADSAVHTATSDVAGLFIADDVQTGKTITFTAPTKPGTYTFHCRYHASMHGTLIVK